MVRARRDGAIVGTMLVNELRGDELCIDRYAEGDDEDDGADEDESESESE